MLVKQNKDTFIRFYGDIAYIKNQRLDLDLVYNETGKYYLSQISRTPRDFDEIVNSLLQLFEDASREMIAEDFGEFVSYLESCGFISTGNNENDISAKELLSTAANSSKTNYPIIQEDVGITHSSALLFKIFKEKPQIFDLQLELTSKCNERCVHCYIPLKDRKNAPIHEMDTDTVKKNLDEAAAMGVLAVTFSGGELLLRKDLVEILQYARQKDFIINLFSNVVLLNDELASKLKEINVNNVQVSLYSMDKNIHEAITTIKGSYDKTKAGIEMLVRHKINVTISCPVMKLNKDSFRQVQEYADSLKIKAGGNMLLIGQGDLNTGNLAVRMDQSETYEFLSDLIKNNEKYQKSLRSKVENYDFNERMVDDKLSCGVGIDTINVAANGDIIPCPGWYGYVLGNIKTDTLNDIWTTSEKLNYLRDIRLSQFPKCVKCDARPYCNMCLLRNFNENNGDLFKIPAHTCQTAHLNKTLTEKLLYSNTGLDKHI